LDDLAEFQNGKSLSAASCNPSGKQPVFGSNGQIARTDELLNSKPVLSMRIPVKSATDSDDIGHPRSVATLAV
jgi:hypothetical protein